MKHTLTASVALALLAGSGMALQIRNYVPATNDRFTGFPSAPVANPTFLHAALDLTGVGWDVNLPSRQFTLVSPRYFVGAHHYPPPIGTPICFLGTDGVVHSSAVESLYSIPNTSGEATDLLLGRLSSPILPSSTVTFL